MMLVITTMVSHMLNLYFPRCIIYGGRSQPLQETKQKNKYTAGEKNTYISDHFRNLTTSFGVTLQGTNISHQYQCERKFIFPTAFGWDMLVARRVTFVSLVFSRSTLLTHHTFTLPLSGSMATAAMPARRLWEKQRWQAERYVYIPSQSHLTKTIVHAYFLSGISRIFRKPLQQKVFNWQTTTIYSLLFQSTFFLQHKYLLFGIEGEHPTRVRCEQHYKKLSRFHRGCLM